jgi:hypothetical protein
MADSKISALPSGAPAQAADEYIVARSGANYKLTLTNIAASMPPIGATTPNTGVFTTVTATTANATTVDATNVEVTNIKAKDGTAAISIADSTGAVTVSTKAEFADGSASAPAITNTGDTDTGMYFPAANEVAVAAGGSVAAAFNSNGLFFRNRIINGDMRIDQRNAGASITLSTTTQYPVDRFASYKGTSGATVTAQQSSIAPTGFVNSIVYTVSTGSAPAAGDINAVWQQIEGTNLADLGFGTANALTVTFSFWVRASVTGTYCVSLANGAGNRFYLATYTVNSANTWEYKTVTIPGDTAGTWLTTTGIGMQVLWDLGYGSNFNGTAGSWGSSAIRRTSGAVQLVANTGATLYITGVQLETGSVATPFERRPYGTELMLCQRYYYRVYGDGTNPQAYISNGISTTQSQANTPFPVTLRTRPTALEQSGNAAHYDISGNVCNAVPAIGGATTANSAITVFTTTAVLAAAGAYQARIINTSGYLGWSAEL